MDERRETSDKSKTIKALGNQKPFRFQENGEGKDRLDAKVDEKNKGKAMLCRDNGGPVVRNDIFAILEFAGQGLWIGFFW